MVMDSYPGPRNDYPNHPRPSNRGWMLFRADSPTGSLPTIQLSMGAGGRPAWPLVLAARGRCLSNGTDARPRWERTSRDRKTVEQST